MHLSTIVSISSLFLLSSASPTSSSDSLLANYRALLRPAYRPSTNDVLTIKRRVQEQKLAARRFSSNSGSGGEGWGVMLEQRDELGMPLPIRMRAARASEQEEQDIEDDWDCAEDSDYSFTSIPVTLSTSDSPITSQTSSVSTPAPSPSSTTPKASSPATQDPTNLTPGSTTVSKGCTRFHTVLSGEICLGIVNYPSNAGLTLDNLLLWNPTINAQCTNLVVGQSLCTAKGAAKRERQKRRTSVPLLPRLEPEDAIRDGLPKATARLL